MYGNVSVLHIAENHRQLTKKLTSN